MPAIWDRMIFYSCAIVSGLTTVVLVASITSPVPAASTRPPHEGGVTIDGWCNPSACTSVGKTVASTRLPRYD